MDSIEDLVDKVLEGASPESVIEMTASGAIASTPKALGITSQNADVPDNFINDEEEDEEDEDED